jgi:hypothetical protein
MHELLETLRLLASHYLPTFYDVLCQHDMVNMFFAYRYVAALLRVEIAHSTPSLVGYSQSSPSLQSYASCAQMDAS